MNVFYQNPGDVVTRFYTPDMRRAELVIPAFCGNRPLPARWDLEISARAAPCEIPSMVDAGISGVRWIPRNFEQCRAIDDCREARMPIPEAKQGIENLGDILRRCLDTGGVDRLENL